MPQRHTDEYKGPTTISEAWERYHARIEASDEDDDEFLEAQTTGTATCETCGQTIGGK